MAAMGVRRDKAALSSGCKSHPANAPAGRTPLIPVDLRRRAAPRHSILDAIIFEHRSARST
jgi:hypothetical protein